MVRNAFSLRLGLGTLEESGTAIAPLKAKIVHGAPFKIESHLNSIIVQVSRIYDNPTSSIVQSPQITM